MIKFTGSKKCIKEIKYDMKNQIEKDIYYLVGQNIKKQRKIKGLTQKKLSEMTFYSYEFIRKIESKSACRNTFSLDTVDKIAKALDINIQILFEPLDELKIS